MQSPGESWTIDDACGPDHAAVPSTTAGCIGLFFSREAGLVAGSAAARSSITGRSRATMSGAVTSRVCVDFVEVEVSTPMPSNLAGARQGAVAADPGLLGFASLFFHWGLFFLPNAR